MNLIGSVYNLNSRDGMHLYYAVKERFGRKLDNREEFIKDTANALKLLIEGYSNVVIPESSNDFLERVIENTGINYVVIKKNSIDIIKKHVDLMNLQKKERETHFQRISEMGDTFKINALKANQRRKYMNILFEKQDIKDNSIIVDDSFFSGTTLTALELVTGCKEGICIFSKQ